MHFNENVPYYTIIDFYHLSLDSRVPFHFILSLHPNIPFLVHSIVLMLSKGNCVLYLYFYHPFTSSNNIIGSNRFFSHSFFLSISRLLLNLSRFYQISNRAFVLFGFFPLLLSVTPINRDPATPSYPLGKRDPARKPTLSDPQPTHPHAYYPHVLYFFSNRYLTTANLPPPSCGPSPFLYFCVCVISFVFFLVYSNH